MNQGVNDVFAVASVITIWTMTIGLVLISLIGTWKVFNKAGHSGIKLFIPICNIYTFYKIAWGNGWIFLLLVIPGVNIIISILQSYKLSRAFGQGIGFALGLFFFPFLFYPILGFGDYLYYGPQN